MLFEFVVGNLGFVTCPLDNVFLLPNSNFLRAFNILDELFDSLDSVLGGLGACDVVSSLGSCEGFFHLGDYDFEVRVVS